MREIVFGILAVFLLFTVSLTSASAQSANTCGINFVSGNSVTYGSLQSGATSSEQTITLSNPGTVVATLSVNGTNWVDGTQTTVINVGNTKFANSTGTYSTKTPLTLTLQNIETLQPSVNTNTYWQLQANLINTAFTGNLTQALNFRVSCDGGQSGGSVPVPDFVDDFSSSAGWTQTGTNIDVDSSVADKLAFAAATNGVDRRVEKPLGTTLSQTSWKADFDYVWTASNVPAHLILYFTDNAGDPSATSLDLIGVWQHSDASNELRIAYKDSFSTEPLPSSSYVTTSVSIPYYLSLNRTNNVVYLNVYTDSGRTIHASGSPISQSVASTIQSLDNVGASTHSVGSPIRSLTATIDNLKIYQNSGSTNNLVTLDVGTKADGTVQGTVTRSSTIKKLGTYSWTTNAGSIKVNTAGANEWALNDGDFTVNFWLYANQLGGNRYIWQHTPQSSAGTNPYVFTQGSTGGNLASFWYADNNSTGYNVYSAPLSSGAWYMATEVRNTANDSYCIYVNSVLQSCTNISDSITFSNAQSDWCLMNYNCQTGSDYALDGYMDDMAVWGQALTQTQINTLYNGGSGNTADSLDLASIKVYWDFEQDPTSTAPQLTNVAPDTVSSGGTQQTPTTFQDDFSSSSGWTQYGSTVSVSNGRADAVSTLYSSGDRIVKDIGFVLGDQFTVDFDSQIVSTQEANSGDVFSLFTLSNVAATHPSSGNADYISTTMVGSWGTTYYFAMASKDDSNSSNHFYCGPTSTTMTQGTTHYYRMQKTTPTNVDLKVYTNPERTNLLTSCSFSIPTTIDDLRYIHMGAGADTGSFGTRTFWTDNISITTSPSNLIFSSDFSSSDGWTQVGTGSSITNGVLQTNVASGMGDMMWKDTGSDLPNKFAAYFDVKVYSADGYNNSSPLHLSSVSGDTIAAGGAGNSVVDFRLNNNNWNVLDARDNGAFGNWGTTANHSDFAMDDGTWRYGKLERNGSTWTLTIYNDPARTTQTFIPVSVTYTPTYPLRYISVGASGDSLVSNFDVDNIKIYKIN